MTEEGVVSNLAEMIADAHKDRMGSFIGAIIEAPPRKGKSSYATKVMRDVFRVLHPELDKNETYLRARKSIYFKIKPFLETIKAKQKEIRAMLPRIDWTQRIPVATLDDASIYAGATLYFAHPDLYGAFQSTMTTIGTALSCVLVTAPTHEALTKCLREYYNYLVVRITDEGRGERLATIQEWYRKKRGGMGLRRIAEDEFTVYIPKKIYGDYLKQRIDLGIEAVDELLALGEQGTIPPAPLDAVMKTAPNFEELEKERAKVMEEKPRELPKRRPWTTLPPAPRSRHPPSIGETDES